MKAFCLFLCAVSVVLASCSAGSEPHSTQASSPPPVQSSMAQAGADRDTARTVVGSAVVEIEYGRPSMGGADRISEVEPGFVWRLGKNEATTMKTSAPLAFGDTTVPAGSYSLFLRKEEGEGWTLLVNSQTGLWGAFDYDAEKDVAEASAEMSTLETPVDLLAIEVESRGEQAGAIVIRWGNRQIEVPFSSASA